MKSDKDSLIREIEPDPLRAIFDGAMTGVTVQPADLEYVLGHGRRRRRAYITGLLMIFMFLGATGVVAVNVLPAGNEPPSIHSAAGASLDGRVLAEIFVFRAFDASDLLRLDGDYYSLGEIHLNDSGQWNVNVARGTCIQTEVVETCRGKPGDTGSVVLEMNDNALRIVEVVGHIFDDRSRESLLAFREPLSANTSSSSGPYWEFSTPQLFVGGHSHIEASMLWVGPIPYEGYGERCRAELSDQQGSLLWTSNWKELPPPPSEGSRTGGITGFGGIPDHVANGGPSAKITCSSEGVSTWNLSDSSNNPKVARTDTGVLVTAELVWIDEAYVQKFTRCDVSVFDETGTEVGRASEWLPGPFGDNLGAPPFHKTISVLVKSDAQSPATAQVDCVPESGPESEARGT